MRTDLRGKYRYPPTSRVSLLSAMTRPRQIAFMPIIRIVFHY